MILVVEPDAATACSLIAALEREAAVRHVDRFAAAVEVIAGDEPLTLVMMRTPLPDGTWDELLAHVRARDPSLPVLVFGDHVDSSVVRRVFALDATFTCAPIAAEDLARFVRRRAPTRMVVPLSDAVRAAVTALATKHALSAQQQRLLALAVEGRSRRQVAHALSLSENTLKSQIRDLLRRCQARSLADLCREAFQIALSARVERANHRRDRAATTE